MLSEEQKERYERHFLIDGFTQEQQDKLNAARILVIGAGGLGSPVLQYLCGAGIGHIGIVEFDTLSFSNLHRQVLYSAEAIGEKKAVLAKKRLGEINSECEIQLYEEKWEEQNAIIIAAGYDVIIDCSDNLPSRRLSDKISKELAIPFVFGAVHQLEGQVAVFNYKGSKSYADLFPENAPPPPRKPIGVLGPVPGVIGSYQAAEALKIISGIGEVLVNRILYISLRTNRNQVMEF